MSPPKLKKAKNGQWYACWSVNRRSHRRSMNTADLVEAKTRFAEWLLHGATPKVADRTVAECWAVYDSKHVETIASPDTARHSWKALEPFFGAIRVSEVTDCVEGYIFHRSKLVKPATIRRELVALRACLRWCADATKRKPLIPAAPAISLPAEAPPRDRWLTAAEIMKLALVAASDSRDTMLFLHLALETAGRRQAILDLTWDRVDLDTKVIHLHDPERRVTKKRRASVPISAALLPLLQEHYGSGRIFGSFDPNRAMERLGRRAGVPGVTPHVLRHTAATHMARRGVPLWQIAKVLGNSVLMVEKVYAKHSPDDLRAAVDQISGGK